MRFAPVVPVLLSSLLLAACGGSTAAQNPAIDAGPDAAGGTDGGSDAATHTDGRSDSNGGACQQTLSAWCAAQTAGQFGSCVSTWAAASTDTEYCATTLWPTVADCGKYHALQVSNVDVWTTYYYDKTSGALVAVVAGSANFGGSSNCVGGPADFVEPSCGSFQPGACADAGSTEAGSGDAGAG